MLNLSHILHPTDFSDNSDQALKYACSLATQFGAELHLINVVHDAGLISPPIAGFIPPDYYEQQIQRATEELASLPEKVLSHSGSVTRNICQGVPFVEIIRYAKENAIDMIVMGTHGYSGLKHVMLGSVAENVVRNAPCPVLTVRPEKHEFVMP
jgi:universal stress protein A